ncbi:hypothetical protein J2Z49_001672 [Desulfofundulus luciae]|uniref:Uncharacterized protein n=1 Tax=Desulfofundulus luciae TaxID=74702 RepID=A0ABU0B1E9_9FIRM|nr:hypothetical protein [Desulfofundulus luciae]
MKNGTKGLIHIWQHNLHDSRRLVADDMDLGSILYGLEYHGPAYLKSTLPASHCHKWRRLFFGRSVNRSFTTIVPCYQSDEVPGNLTLFVFCAFF